MAKEPKGPIDGGEQRPWDGPTPANPPGQPRQYARGRVPPADLPALKRRKRGILPPPIAGPIPDSWDSRANGLVPPVKNQGACGSCWDFSGVGVVEIAMIGAGLISASAADALSEQFVLDCGSNGGCNGDDNTTVLDMAEARGLCHTRDYGPYTARAGACRYTPSMPLLRIAQWGFCDGGHGEGVTPTPLLQQAIMANGAVGCAVAAGGSWDNYRGGEYAGSGYTGLDHDVILCGWRPSTVKPGKIAWLLRNSWGTGWGESGYMWITEGADLIGYEGVFARAGDGPTPPPPPPPPPPPGLTFSVNVPQQPVVIFGLTLGHVPAFTVQGVIEERSLERLPAWLLAILRAVCSGAATIPPPLGPILVSLCGLIPPSLLAPCPCGRS